MSMYVGLQYPEKLAGIVALSGYLPHYGNFEEVRQIRFIGILELIQLQLVSDANRETDLFAAHGDADQVVKLEYGQRAHDRIAKFNKNASLKVYPNLQHSSSRAEMQAVFDFVMSHLK